MNKAQYDRYLKSNGWKQKRQERLDIDGWKCAVCGSKESLNVHHITYENVGHENVKTDLVTLCHRCHATLHRIREASKKEYNDLQTRKGPHPETSGILKAALYRKVESLLVVELWMRNITAGGDLKLFDTGMRTTRRMVSLCEMIYKEIKSFDIKDEVVHDLQLIRAARIVETYSRVKSIDKTAKIMKVSETSVQKTLKRHGFNAYSPIK